MGRSRSGYLRLLDVIRLNTILKVTMGTADADAGIGQRETEHDANNVEYDGEGGECVQVCPVPCACACAWPRAEVAG
jgi:hypothetical protein